MRDFSVLSDIEFEEVVADLLGAELGLHVERYARGADGGVDLRWKTRADDVGIGQCKHYNRSTFSQLLSSARGEIAHLKQLSPGEYRFITSQDLTPGQKSKLAKELSPWITSPSDVFGARDIDGLLTRHERVEQAHPKLWLSSGTQLFWATHSDIAARSAALKSRVESTIHRYVMNPSFRQGVSMLKSERVCVIAGVPGVGKTTLAHALLADAIARGYEPVEVSRDIDEAWSAYRPGAQQIFLYDDFLGQLTFSERLGKNEDSRLSSFIEQIAASGSKQLIMTTREYIFQDALRVYDKLSSIDSRKHLVLELGAYSRRERSRILYNHLWHSRVPLEALREIASHGSIQIIDHRNYNPRLIEHCTSPAFDLASPAYPDRFIENLEHPDRVWRIAFEQHLSTHQQLMLVALATLPQDADLNDLTVAHAGICRKRGVGSSASDTRSSLQVLEGTFLAATMRYGVSKINFHNPSIRAFVLDWIGQDRELLRDLMDSAEFFEQISSLHRFAHGVRRLGLSAEPSRSHLARAVTSLELEMRLAFERLIDSATPERGGKWVTDVNTPVASRVEDRLIFLLEEASAQIYPGGSWLDDQLRAVARRWSDGQGSKDRAVRLVSLAQRAPTAVAERTLENLETALDSWLESGLEETDDDWIPYLSRLRDRGIALEHEDALAAAFTAHAMHELDRWSPSPPYMTELIEAAEDFGLSDLVLLLREKEESAEAGASDDIPEPATSSQPTAEPPITDSEIETTFARLGLAPTAGDDEVR